MYLNNCFTHARIQKVLSEGTNFDNVFLVDMGRWDPNTTISGRVDNGPTLNGGLIAFRCLRGSEPGNLFCDFSGAGWVSGPHVPPLGPSMLTGYYPTNT